VTKVMTKLGLTINETKTSLRNAHRNASTSSLLVRRASVRGERELVSGASPSKRVATSSKTNTTAPSRFYQAIRLIRTTQMRSTTAPYHGAEDDLQRALADFKKFSECPSDPDGPEAVQRVTKPECR